MNVENKKCYLSNAIDFLTVNLITVLVIIYIDSILEFLFPSNVLYFMNIPKSYTPFIEGIIVGVLIGTYIFLKKKVNTLFILLGMWLYPLTKYTLYKPLDDLESWLIYLSELSMFLGVVCIFVYAVRFSLQLPKRKRPLKYE